MQYEPDDMTQMMGIGNYEGEMRQGPDGKVYQWINGVDGLGNPIGWWSVVASALAPLARKAVKWVAKRGVRAFSKRGRARRARGQKKGAGLEEIIRYLRNAGLVGVDSEIIEAPDGQHYEAVQGIGEFGQPTTMYRPVRLMIPAHISYGYRTRPYRETSPEGGGSSDPRRMRAERNRRMRASKRAAAQQRRAKRAQRRR